MTEVLSILDPLRKGKWPVLITEHRVAAAILLEVGSYKELTKRAAILDRMVQIQFEITKAMTTIWSYRGRVMQRLPAQGITPNSATKAD